MALLCKQLLSSHSKLISPLRSACPRVSVFTPLQTRNSECYSRAHLSFVPELLRQSNSLEQSSVNRDHKRPTPTQDSHTSHSQMKLSVAFCLIFCAHCSTYCADTSCSSSMPRDPDGFDPQADTVGAGIYGGKVKRDAEGNILSGRQYENHNKRPGPIYTGGGYTEMSTAIHKGPEAVKLLLEQHPELSNDISTGGASPLHTCGMSRMGQMSTKLLIDAGGELNALDTYGYTPLHRMASNNLAIGAAALIAAGANATLSTGSPYEGDTPLATAQQASAHAVIDVLRKAGVTH